MICLYVLRKNIAQDMSVFSVSSSQPKSQGRSWTKVQSKLLWSEAYETPSNVFANSVDPDQAALVRAA